LDTGNSRLLVADAATGRVKSVLAGNEALRGQAATGMAVGARGLWVVNWRANELMLLDLQSNECGRTARSRSVIIVYPEAAWRGAIADSSSRLTTTGESVIATGEGEPNLGVVAGELGVSMMRQARRQPYTLEVEPALRRLAGLTALPDTSPFLVAVDLGGQSAHCLRFV
uniref:Gmad1 domain-containing protein n=1 Tax=Hydatigena taeniaeformis TaxID=6205 RepID=A0A0R3WP60_HYDTA